jgi:hypothetical protein
MSRPIAMDGVFIEPGDGDVVVVGASHAPDGRLQPPRQDKRYALIMWGDFALVSDRLASLSRDEAMFEARHCAAERGRTAWDSTGQQMVKLPRLPLVYRGVGDTYVVSVDVTDYTDPQASLLWRSASYLGEHEAIGLLVGDGIPRTVASALIGKAPMPLACS